MRTAGWGALGAAVVVLCVPAISAAGPYVRAQAAIVMDAKTGEVLWSRRPDVARPPASTTKVMTALLAVESGRLDQSFTVSAAAQSRPATKIGLRQGQRMKLDDLLHAILLNSANDAAVVIAEGLGGSVAAFGRQMTNRARALGARNATFRNPHGLPQRGHVASARDLAIIFRYAMKEATIRRVLQTTSIRVPVWGRRRVRHVSLRSHNRLLNGYKYRVIGKTGYTRAAGKCFVGSSRHGGREVVVALLGSTDLWGDLRRMFAWAFAERGSWASTQTVRRERTPAVAHRHGSETAVERAAPPAPGPAWTTASPIDASGEAPAGVSRFTVRFGPFADDGTVKRAKATLADRGYAALLSGRALRLGSFTSASLAFHLADRMRRSGWEADVVALD
jgi:serine-type D-Ala-D-Ala carboxypeptidase (penicillin-binding protein 5/6)